jgi:hypothetical protein
MTTPFPYVAISFLVGLIGKCGEFNRNIIMQYFYEDSQFSVISGSKG